MRFWVVILGACLNSAALAQAESPSDKDSYSQKLSGIPDNPFEVPATSPPEYEIQDVINATCDSRICIKPREGVTLVAPMQSYGYDTTMVEYATTEFLYGGSERCETQYSNTFSNLADFAKYYRPDDTIGSCKVNVYQEIYKNDRRKIRLILAMSCVTDKGRIQVTLSMPEKEKKTTLGILSIKESGKKSCRYRTIVAERPTDEDTWYSWDHVDNHGSDPLTYVEEHL